MTGRCDACGVRNAAVTYLKPDQLPPKRLMRLPPIAVIYGAKVCGVCLRQAERGAA